MKTSLKVALTVALAGTAYAQKFQHIVIMVQENRTPDNIFGSSPHFEPGVDIAQSGLNSQNMVIQLTPVALGNCYDIGHAHGTFLKQYNGGLMNGFDKIRPTFKGGCVPGPNPQYRYIDNSSRQVQPYFDLAKQYGFANRMFQSNQGASFAAHQFLVSGTSAPTDTSDLFVANNQRVKGGGSGCTAGAGSTADTIDPTGNFGPALYPCFTRSSLIENLQANNLTWKYYTPSGQIQWNALQALKPYYTSAKIITKQGAILTDIANCNLTNVAWVNPPGGSSDHAGNLNGTKGPSWVASVVNAVGTSTCGYWTNTAIVVTWDDWGGWYDHVPPFRIGQPNGWGVSYVYGFRVPLLVISAYTPAGYVSNDVHDFGSILRFVETNFNLSFIGPGTWADSYADDLGEFFSLSKPRGFTKIQSSYNAQYFLTHEDSTPPDND